ncbi:uncharacterized protein LOC131157042 isoform X2 [Malania oleifera]|uniref:uncharacterized protein LOC131157042 isoform X2 n=1 Tax=Malania oleifera TaxID=397392 RepID=UPI0025ADA839|nr:uncharacterized protein LOC131157042 isoform X2 [Malania oleifera]
MKKKKNLVVEPSKAPNASQAFLLHLICASGVAAALWVAHNVYSIDMVSNPTLTLGLIWVIESPMVVLLYSWFRQNRKQCSYWKAVGRGMLGIPAGALANALGAIALGAPVGIQQLPKTINWSLLMSLFTLVPAASVYGSSWMDWKRIFAHTKPIETIDYMICLPAHGAVIGAWFGAWPMPLDWERQWQGNTRGSFLVQEWPICVTYGAMVGYVVAMVASFGLVVIHDGRQHNKGD